MGVLVRTFAPNTNPNYGGVLQAWAMQRAITGIGFDAYVDASRVARNRPNRLQVWAGNARRTAAPALTRCAPMLPARFQSRVIKRELGRRITEFAERRIPLVRLFDANGRLIDRTADRFGAFVVGSDQVWRPEYSDIRSFLLDFLPEDDTRPKFSYAASFGVDAPNYSAEDNSDYSRLAQRMSGVSVREKSGVSVAGDMWGVDAVQHVDPTMLISRAEYALLAQEATDPVHRGQVVSYVLDRTQLSIETEESVSVELGEPCLRLMPDAPSSIKEMRERPHLFQRPSVEAWVGAIHGARFLVTDSFHGVVFAILGNVPFVAVCNRKRGATRFESLLSTFGLMDRMVEPGTVLTCEDLASPIDWDRVNERLADERARSLEYLRSMLSPADEFARDAVAVTASR
ncbi:polysaccharide pyruvyl transferase family protein [Xylanimonas cellulosilytica]|nr:polysaccharide pyruvyl transferase family protein [Xylanimonas cellulosilytica]